MRSNASTFRSFNRIEDQMIRAAMPRTVEREAATARVTDALGALIDAMKNQPQPLTYTLAEVVA